MPMIYTVTLATAGNSATNATPGTETDNVFVKAGVRNAALQACYMIGKAAGLTSISGIAARIVRFTTASTAGTGAGINAKDPGMQTAKFTSSTLPTAGATRSQQVIFGCGAAGPGGWVAPNPDSVIQMEGGGALSVDMMTASGTASLNHEWSLEVVE